MGRGIEELEESPRGMKEECGTRLREEGGGGNGRREEVRRQDEESRCQKEGGKSRVLDRNMKGER